MGQSASIVQVTVLHRVDDISDSLFVQNEVSLSPFEFVMRKPPQLNNIVSVSKCIDPSVTEEDPSIVFLWLVVFLRLRNRL